jgi:hypothetical protein
VAERYPSMVDDAKAGYVRSPSRVKGVSCIVCGVVYIVSVCPEVEMRRGHRSHGVLPFTALASNLGGLGMGLPILSHSWWVPP